LNKTLLIGVAALAVLSLWLVVLFGHDSPTTNVSFTPPVYAQNDSSDNGGGTLVYGATIFTALPAWEGYCKTVLAVQHLSYDQLQCCCHTAWTIWVEIRTLATCACDVPWRCDLHHHGGMGQICEYDEYRTPIFVVPDHTTFYYRFFDASDPTVCVVSGSFSTDCWP